MSVTLNDLDVVHFRTARFLAEYCAALDEERYRDWVECFADDGTYTVTNRTNQEKTGLMLVAEAGREALKERAAYLDGYFQASRRTTSRLVTNLRVELDGDLIVAKSKFLLLRSDRAGRTQVHAAGSFTDRLADRGDRLRYVAHQVVVDADLLPSNFTDLL